MPEPTTAASAVVAAAMPALAVPIITLLGFSTGLRPDVLLAGFFGGLIGIVLLDSSPGAIDDWRTMLATSTRRLFVMIAASLTAGYLTPLAQALLSLSDNVTLSVAAVVGASAQHTLRAFVDRLQTTLRSTPVGGGQ